MRTSARGASRSRLPAGPVARAVGRQVVGLLVASLAAVLPPATSPAAAATSWGWYRADLHVHSALSADALPDLGIVSRNAKAAGYQAVFVTDHGLGSSFEINHLTANHMVLEDDLTRWATSRAGSTSSSTNTFASSPVHSGTKSLHLAATSGTAGETAVWTKRGPNLRNGDAMVRFSIYPVRLDAGSGLYVSAALGGDRTVASPVGYTTTAGVVTPGLSKVFSWYFGAPPPSSFYGSAQLVTRSLAGSCDKAFQTGTWITCTIDLNAALGALSAADQPLPDDAWQDLKMAAVGAGGTADAYFDSYSVDASAPRDPGEEFVHRDTFLGQTGTGTWDVPGSFRLFPSIELGIAEHSQRFDFGISDPAQFVQWWNGVDGIVPTQQTGYPAQLNHPDVPGGVTRQEAVDNDAYGADLVEVRQVPMIATWDDLLVKGVQVIGTWGTDNHSASWGSGSQATFISAPALEFDALQRSLFEGRLFLGNVGAAWRLGFNLAAGSSAPYPARYPVYVAGGAMSATVHLAIGPSIPSGATVAWIVNGATVASEAAGTSYERTRTVSLSGTTYVRAELRSSSGSPLGMSEPIFFVPLSGLPSGMSAHLDAVTTASGHDYTKLVTKGITVASWDATAQALDLGLTDPSGALVELEAATAGRTPSGVSVAGVTVAPSASRADFDAATGSTWFHDASAGILHVKAVQGSGTTPVVLRFGGTPPPSDTTPPSVPTGLAATPVSASRIDLAWTASSDPDSAVAGYGVYRDGTLVATVATAAYRDTGLAASSTHSYAVDAVDPAGNRSARSPAVGATTLAGGGGTTTTTFSPVADAYVQAAYPTTNYGTRSALRVDGSPVVRSYLRFSLAGLSGTVTKATLRVYANSAQSSGYDAWGVVDTSWGEATITYATAPPLAAAKTGSSGPVSAGSWTSVDVTALVAGAGALSLGLTTSSSTALSLASRESADGPQLIVETTP